MLILYMRIQQHSGFPSVSICCHRPALTDATCEDENREEGNLCYTCRPNYENPFFGSQRWGASECSY